MEWWYKIVASILYTKGCTAPKHWSEYTVCLPNILYLMLLGFFVDRFGVLCTFMVGEHYLIIIKLFFIKADAENEGEANRSKLKIHTCAEIVETTFVFPTLHCIRVIFVYIFFVSPRSNSFG